MQDMTVLVFVVVLGRGFVNYYKHLCAAHAQLSTTADELCELLGLASACVLACSPALCLTSRQGLLRSLPILVDSLVPNSFRCTEI